MPRIARVVVKGYPYHITQRGNYKQNTFDNSEDYQKYLKWIKQYCDKYGLSILAYCLMTAINEVLFTSFKLTN